MIRRCDHTSILKSMLDLSPLLLDGYSCTERKLEYYVTTLRFASVDHSEKEQVYEKLLVYLDFLLKVSNSFTSLSYCLVYWLLLSCSYSFWATFRTYIFSVLITTAHTIIFDGRISKASCSKWTIIITAGTSKWRRHRLV